MPRRLSSALSLAVSLAVSLASLAGCVGSSSTMTASAPADLVIRGPIVTLDETTPSASALAARDGRIVAVGERADVDALVGPATEVIELAPGEVAYPGFVEAHGHFLGVGDTRLQLDLRGAATWDAIVAMVAAAAAEAPPGTWIRGRGWHQEKWTSPPSPEVEGFPVHDALSAATPEHPVLLTHASGHAVFVNARALAAAGIDDATADPPGGEILRDAAGRATGLLREDADALLAPALAAAGDDLTARRIELATRECLAKGVTSFHDAGSGFREIAALARAAEDGRLGVRLWVMVREPNAVLAARLPETRHVDVGDGMLTLGGIKVSMDGALGSRGAWLLEPYADSPGAVGLPLVTPESLRETAEIAVANGLQLCVHAIGDRANREVLDVFEATFRAHPEMDDHRWRVEHAQHLHPEDVPRFADLGVVASMQTVHCTSDGPWVPDRLGEERAREESYLWRTLLDGGAVVVNGTDAPVEDVDPIANFHAAVTREMADGRAFHPEERMTREEALRSMTRDAAWAAFQEDDVGALVVGKRADVVVLSQDLLAVPEDAIRDTEVVATIVGGRVVHRAEP